MKEPIDRVIQQKGAMSFALWLRNAASLRQPQQKIAVEVNILPPLVDRIQQKPEGNNAY